MASASTRSSRRVEGLTARTERTIHQNNNQNRQSLSNTSLRKRPRDPTDVEQDIIDSKKARIAFEIDSRSNVHLEGQLKKRRLVITSNTNSGVVSQRSTKQSKAPTQTAIAKARQPTKHAEKVIYGIKHDLYSLQLSGADTRDEKRKLRSQEGTRFKSELSAYFPDYDVVIGNEPEETHFLNIDTPIIITDSNPPTAKAQQSNSPKSRQTASLPPESCPRYFPDALFDNLYQAQKVDFAFLDKHCKVSLQLDPLPDVYFENAHRKAERLEKSIRNSEKGRAQHERDQVIRLLGGLQGHDWLKVMGVSGITESKKKDYEPAREYFIKGCLGILEKFRTWRDEEKRRKLEKEKALAEVDEDENNESDGDPPDYSDVDHAAARQLHQEAIARSAPVAVSKATEKKVKAEARAKTVADLEKEFKSFYSKPYLREAAIGKHRRSGRSISAWGQPVPDVPQRDFDLPEEYRDKETLEANARRRRRDRRESKE